MARCKDVLTELDVLEQPDQDVKKKIAHGHLPAVFCKIWWMVRARGNVFGLISA